MQSLQSLSPALLDVPVADRHHPAARRLSLAGAQQIDDGPQRDVATPALMLEDGIQSGIVLTIPRGRTLVGAGIDADIVIEGAEVAPAHFLLSRDADDLVVLHALAPIRYDGRSLAAGSEIAVSGSVRLEVGGRGLLIDMPERRPTAAVPSPASVAGTRPAWLFAAGGTLLVLLSGALTAVLTGPGREPVVQAARSPALSLPGDPQTGRAASTALRRQLDAAGLGGLSVVDGENGALAVGGILLPTQQPAWDAVHQWFDARFGGRQMLLDRTGTFGSAPPLRIASVWLGSTPYVVDGDGRKLFLGSIIDGGWTIAAITPQEIRLTKQARTIAVHL